jgi:hypothetical protein
VIAIAAHRIGACAWSRRVAGHDRAVASTIGRRVGRYEILEVIGRGGMATVYLARQTDLARDVALKELMLFDGADPLLVRRFLREARLAGSLGHPNIVTVHDYIEEDGTPYIAMEYMPGGSLRPHVGYLSLAQIGGVLNGLLNGLAYAEERGVVHRDLKPENMMLTGQGWVKIADFGIAKATSAAQATANLTTTGTTLGTPRYMAPERAMGDDVGPWSDLYSVGVIVFELLVGRTPFHDTEAPMAVLMRQINEDIPPVSSLVPDVDPALSEWVERLLIKDPAERIRSAATAWDQLEDILTAQLGARWVRRAGVPAHPGGPSAALRQMPRPAPRERTAETASTAQWTASTWSRTRMPGRTRVAARAAVGERGAEGETEAPFTIPLPRQRAMRRRRLLTSRRRVIIAALLVVGVAALAAAGRGGGGEPSRPAAATSVAAGTDRALVELDRRGRTHRARLAAARTGADRAGASRALAADYAHAARAVERIDAVGSRRLVAALVATAASYRQAATGAERGDSGAFDAAHARAQAGEAAVGGALAAAPAVGVPQQGKAHDSGAVGEDDSGVGDSKSDDPSDDEPDGPEP